VVAVVNGIGSHDMAVTGCVGIVGCDVGGSGDGRGIGMVGLEVVWDRLGVSVDVSVSLSGCSGMSWDAVCVMVSMVTAAIVWLLESVVTLVVSSVCMPLLTSTFLHFVPSCLAVLPCSTPSFSPFSYPSHLPSSLASDGALVLSCSSCR
jgi:hypothetical protein